MSERALLGVEVVGPEWDAAVQGWRTFLQQEGLAFAHSSRATGRFPVVVAVPAAEPGPAPTGAVEILDGFLPERESFLPVAVQSIRAGRRRIRVCGVARVPGFPEDPGARAPGVPQLVPFADERAPHSLPGYAAWVLRGRRFLLPMCLGEQMASVGSGFHAYEEAEDEAERVELLLSTIDHNGVRGILQQLMRTAFGVLRLPYVRKWYYPTPCPSVLLGRIDVDVLDSVGVRHVLAAATSHRRRMTFFVNGSGEEEIEDALGPRHATPRVEGERTTLEAIASQGGEIAAHGWWHTVFSDRAACLEDLRRSVDALRGLGAKPSGYGGPGGAWYPAVTEALGRLHLDYSSELGASFEGFPAWAPGAGPEHSLHVPVSPMIQDCLARGRQQTEVLERWRHFLHGCVATGEPASFVLHTQDLTACPGLLDALLAAADRFGLGDMTFSELARWWRRRALASLTAVWDGGNLEVAVDDDVLVFAEGAPLNRSRGPSKAVTADA